MKHLLLGVLACILFGPLHAQDARSINVNGDIDKFYPVVFKDEGWDLNAATELEINRPHMHVNSNNRGTMMAKFSFHTNNWGNGSQYINADVHQYSFGLYQHFVAGWVDASHSNGDKKIVIWLRGGGTTYELKSNFSLTAVSIYDTSPFVTSNGASYGHKTLIDPYVNSMGLSTQGSLYFEGSGNSVIMGKLGIGTNTVSNNISFPQVDASEAPVGISWYTSTSNDPTFYGIHRTAGAWTPPAYQQLRLGWQTGLVLDPGASYNKSYVDVQGGGLRVTSGSVGIGTINTGDYKLAVEGTIGARKIKVTQATWADYVFAEDYKRLSLPDLENYIKVNRHLPGIPTEAEVKKDGVDVGEMNKKLLEKIEELTLHLIELKKEVEELKKK